MDTSELYNLPKKSYSTYLPEQLIKLMHDEANSGGRSHAKQLALNSA